MKKSSTLAPATFTEEELAQFFALAEAEPIPDREPNVYRTKELSKIWGIGEYATRSRLRSLLEQGYAETTQIQIRSLSGRASSVVAYRLIKSS